MRKGGKYRNKAKKSRKTIFVFIFSLILFLGLLSISIRINNGDEDTVGFEETESTMQTQILQQTLAAEEPTSESVQLEEKMETTFPTVTATTVYTTTATESTVEFLPETQEKSETLSEDVPEGYASVLEQYRELIMMDSREFLKLYGNESELDLALSVEALRGFVDDGDIESIAEILERPTLSKSYPYVNGATLYSAKMYRDGDDWDPTVYHYAYYNIDGQRGDELLIGQYNDYHDAYTILAIYTAKYYAPANLGVKSIADNSRAHLTIYTDGTICLDFSGGAAHHYWEFYTIDGMYTSDLFEEIASFYINYDSSKSEYMASAVEGYEAMLTPVEDIIWQPLIEK